jgi:outer membrane murein-binding lipoprotein Lpp
MFMRRRPLLRAAVVGGGAYVAGKHMANKANEQASNEAYQNQRIDQLEQQQQPQYQDQQQYAPPPQQAPPPDAAPAAGPSMADQLQQIATLHQQGVLSDDEFAAAKAKLLGS